MPPGKGSVPEQAGTRPRSPRQGKPVHLGLGGQSWVGDSLGPEGLKALRESHGNVGCDMGLLNGG